MHARGKKVARKQLPACLSAQVDFETELYMANILNGMKSQIAAGAEFPHVFMSLHQGREAIEVAKAK